MSCRGLQKGGGKGKKGDEWFDWMSRVTEDGIFTLKKTEI